jgi:hypothetical protein
MVKPQEDKTGNKIKYTGTRDLNAVPTKNRLGILPTSRASRVGQLVEFARPAPSRARPVLDMNAYKAETSRRSRRSDSSKASRAGLRQTAVGLIWYNPDVSGDVRRFRRHRDVDLGT